MSPVILALEWHFAFLVTVTHENYFSSNQVAITAFTTFLSSVKVNIM
jgi:hypothetical protein